MVDEAPKTGTQAVEESKRHAQGATLLQDRLNAPTSERLEEHGEVRGAHPQAPPRHGDVKPAAPSRDPYRQREGWNYPSGTLPMTKSPGSSSPVPHPLQGLEECRVHLQERHLREDTKLCRRPLAINGFAFKAGGSERNCRGYKNPKEIHGRRTVMKSCRGMDRKKKRMTSTLATAVG